MPRAPNQKAEEARKLFESGKKLIEIAEQIDVPVGTIRSWKNRYKWECNVAEKKCNVAIKKKKKKEVLETKKEPAAEAVDSVIEK